MLNTEQTIRDTIKLVNSARWLPGGCSEFPLRKVFACVLLCTRKCLVLVQGARIRMNFKILNVKVWKNSYIFVFNAFFFTWRLKPQESPSGALLNSYLSSRLWLDFRSLCRPEVHVWTDKARCFMLAQLVFQPCIFFKLWLHRKIGIEKNQLFSCVLKQKNKTEVNQNCFVTPALRENII